MLKKKTSRFWQSRNLEQIGFNYLVSRRNGALPPDGSLGKWPLDGYGPKIGCFHINKLEPNTNGHHRNAGHKRLTPRGSRQWLAESGVL